MSDRVVQLHSNGGEMSGKYTATKHSGWMGHWMQPKYKQCRDGEMKQPSLSCNQVDEPSGSNAVTATIEGDGSRSMEVISKIGTDESHLKKESSDLLSFPIFNMNKRGGNKQVIGTQTGQSSEFVAATTRTIKPHSAFAFGRQLQEMRIAPIECELLPKESTPSLELELRARDSVEGGNMPSAKSSKGKLPAVPSGCPYGVMYRNEKNLPFSSTSRECITHHPFYHDVNIDTMRITSTLNARQDIHFGTPMYTETTRHFFVTEGMSIGVSEEGKIFGESVLSSKFSGNLGGLLSSSPAPGQIRPGLKLQLLDSSTDSEQKGKGSEDYEKHEGSQSIGRLNTMSGGLMDETSAETRTLEVDVLLEETHTYGLDIAGLTKDALQGQSTALSQEKSAKILLPDMNEVAHSPYGSLDQGEPSISRTQSLDMECFFSKNECPGNTKSNPGHISRSELGSRWVKRLKLSSSNATYTALGTKSSKTEEALSYDKLRKLSSSIFHRNVSQAYSEFSTDTCLRNTSLSKKTSEDPNISNSGKNPSTDSLKEDRKALLSHSWIRRWCHSRSSSSKNQPTPTEPCETQKTDVDHFQKKSFPSIAAMALMGKAMNGFRPCEFTKKGSFIVWNTNNLPND